MNAAELKALGDRIERLIPDLEAEGWLTASRLMRRYIGEAQAIAERVPA